MKRTFDDIDNDNGKGKEETNVENIENEEEIYMKSQYNKEIEELNNNRKCPYLDTINRNMLDFDMNKICSITLSNVNVYCCLVCGKFFQGRSKTTPAYTHSVQSGHFVFINLTTTELYCLPDNYIIHDNTCQDIKSALQPTYTTNTIQTLTQSNRNLIRDIHGVSYLPGFIGLNNMRNTDYVNVILHVFAHIEPLRDYFLNPTNYANTQHQSNLVIKFGEVMRRIWSKHNYKSIVSPHEFLHEISSSSDKRFVVGVSAEPIDLLSWMLDELHR